MSESITELTHLAERRKVTKDGTYGHIPQYPVGTRFEDREMMYNCGFHVTLQAGIQGREATGACSVVLSGGYEDDIDLGYEFTYTGHGGQLPMQNKDRSQKRDQEWVRGNLALKMSCKLRQPIRVIRGHKLLSRWAPAEGYRYDGLYNVTEYDRKPGTSGFLVCLFRFERCPGQPPLPEPTGPPQEQRTLSHISPSLRSPPPTPRISAKKRRRTSEVDTGPTSKKIKTSTVDRPIFVQGSSTSAISPSLRLHTVHYGGPSDFGRAPPQMSPEYREGFSEGPPSSYGTGKEKSVDRLSSSLGIDNAGMDVKVDDDDIYMSDEPDVRTNHIVPKPEIEVQVEDIYQNLLAFQDQLQESFNEDDDDDLLDAEFAYPEESEMLSQRSAWTYSSPLNDDSNEHIPEYEEAETQTRRKPVVEYTYEDQEATIKPTQAGEATTAVTTEGRVDSDEKEEEEEEEETTDLQYAIRSAPLVHGRQQSQSDETSEEETAANNKDAEKQSRVVTDVEIKKEEEEEEEEEEEKEDEDEEDGDDDSDGELRIPIMFQYAIRTGGHPSRRKMEDGEVIKHEDEEDEEEGPIVPTIPHHTSQRGIYDVRREEAENDSDLEEGELVDELAEDDTPLIYSEVDTTYYSLALDSPRYVVDDEALGLVDPATEKMSCVA